MATKRAREARVAELDEYTRHEESLKKKGKDIAREVLQKALKKKAVNDQGQQEQ